MTGPFTSAGRQIELRRRAVHAAEQRHVAGKKIPAIDTSIIIGLAAGLARAGGNVTGLSDLAGKRP